VNSVHIDVQTEGKATAGRALNARDAIRRFRDEESHFCGSTYGSGAVPHPAQSVLGVLDSFAPATVTDGTKLMPPARRLA